jgi:hypothetical protein
VFSCQTITRPLTFTQPSIFWHPPGISGTPSTRPVRRAADNAAGVRHLIGNVPGERMI